MTGTHKATSPRSGQRARPWLFQAWKEDGVLTRNTRPTQIRG